MADSSSGDTLLEVGVERLPDSEVRLTVQAPAAEADAAIARAISQLARQVRIPGFRPGKAPQAVVERTVGWPAVREEAIEQGLTPLYQRALRQEGLEPVTAPKVSEVSLERGEPVRFTASFVARPPVTLGDYRAIRVPREVRTVEDAEVDSTIEELRQRYAQVDDVEGRPVGPGDVVTARLTMHHGGEVVGTPDQVQLLDLERGDLLPGMREQLLGAELGGEPVEITLTLPEDYSRPELQGELVTITAAVTRIQAKELPPLDDNLASIVGRGETLEELRQYVREQMAAQLAMEAERDQDQKALEELLALTRVDVPEVMIQAEIDRQLGEMDRSLRDSGLSLEALAAAQGKTLEQLRGERRQAAVERVRLDLALTEVASMEGLSLNDEELDQAVASVLPRNASREERRRLRDPLGRELLRGRARELVLRLARGEEDQPTEGG